MFLLNLLVITLFIGLVMFSLQMGLQKPQVKRQKENFQFYFIYRVSGGIWNLKPPLPQLEIYIQGAN